MYKITRQSLAASVADKWGRQYSDRSYWVDKVETHEKLLALGENPCPDQVDEIIGNKSWTETKCDECGNKNIDVIRVGEPLNYESKTADICLECLGKAFALAKDKD